MAEAPYLCFVFLNRLRASRLHLQNQIHEVLLISHKQTFILQHMCLLPHGSMYKNEAVRVRCNSLTPLKTHKEGFFYSTGELEERKKSLAVKTSTSDFAPSIWRVSVQHICRLREITLLPPILPSHPRQVLSGLNGWRNDWFQIHKEMLWNQTMWH